jgi:hypothetical protein
MNARIGRIAVLAVCVPLAAADGSLDLLPTPHFVQPLNRTISIRGPVPVFSAHDGLQSARELLSKAWPTLRFQDAAGSSSARIVLWNNAAGAPPLKLSDADRQLLETHRLREQAYVILPDGNALWVIGGGPAGVQHGAATVAQLLRPAPNGAALTAAIIRDAPDFEYRAASDWLLATELNRWAYDRGTGFDGFTSLMKSRLDRSAQYKINMALVDGFGWSLATRPHEYPVVMRDLNRYARRRGIRLLYGGYGAAYDLAARPGEHHGAAHLNRDSYPDGEVYSCLTYPNGKSQSGTLGTCRANDELNRVKGEELAHFVDAVEPGGVYIHHEDCCVFEDFQKAWLGRCERCRKRWPNDSLVAPDGGAGALAHGYSSLINSVNRVRHDGFDASRDTEIVIVSPVYMPDDPTESEWSNVLELWRNITKQLTPAPHVQVCFREIMPQPGGGKRWMERFQAIMKQESLPFQAFVFFAGGSDGFLSNYPMSGAPAMTAHFLGARSIFHATGDFYVEPMELIAAEYAWNVQSNGFYRNPTRESDIDEIARWVHNPGEPAELFGEGKLFDRVCARLYGESAGREMARYYRLRRFLPDVSVPPAQEPKLRHPYYRRRNPPYLRRVFDYVTALPTHWDYFGLEAGSWKTFPATADDRETHRRRARLWSMSLDLGDQGRKLVAAARAANPKPEAIPDLDFLLALFEVHRPLLLALRDFHTALQDPAISHNRLSTALVNARLAVKLARSRFPNPVDPALGEVRAIAKRADELASAIEQQQRSRR